MKKIYFLIILFVVSYSVKSQSYQISIGGSKTTSSFNSVKYDPNDGGTINAGYINDSVTGNGRDWLIVKLDKSQKIVWQKVIKNSGDDFIYKVIVCANGDYVAVGELTQNGISRGYVCRINSSNGNIIWSVISDNSSIGEIFYDVIETTNGNIAISGTDNWAVNYTNSFIVLLNSAGKTIWSMVSTYASPDEPYAISQLPNGNLIVGCSEWVGSHFNLIIMELKEMTGATSSENSYSINTTAPNSSLFLNSIWAWGINVRNGQASIYCLAFQGASSSSSMCIYNYDTLTKSLSGNIYYHIGDNNAINYAYSPLDSNDFLIAQSFSNPNRVYISRVTNGAVVYDDLINNSVTSINAADTTAGNAVFSGNINSNNHINTYNLFTSRTDPNTNLSCSITSSNTLALKSSTLDANSTNEIGLVSQGVLNTASPSYNSSNYAVNDICGTALPVTFLNFKASLDNLSKTTLLTWQTANEINNNYFEIERSADGKTFTSIGTVEGSNAVKTATYSFTDVKPATGTNLYRLKQVDNDGKFIYSKIVSVDLEGSSLFAAYPNPSANNINLIIPLSTSTSTLSIYDLNGKKILEQRLSANITSKHLDISKLASGMYNIVLIQNANRFFVKLIKR